MASGLFCDPLVALRALPLVSSTCTLLYARDQQFFFSTLQHPGLRTRSRSLVSPYFAATFYRGLTFVVGVLGVTTWSSVANLYVHRSALHARQSFRWYVASAVLSASHLLFVPWIATSCKNLVCHNPDREDLDAIDAMDEWLWINRVRMLTVDLAAWVVTAVAVTKTLRTD